MQSVLAHMGAVQRESGYLGNRKRLQQGYVGVRSSGMDGRRHAGNAWTLSRGWLAGDFLCRCVGSCGGGGGGRSGWSVGRLGLVSRTV